MIKKINFTKYIKFLFALGVVVAVIIGSTYAYHVTHKKKPIATVNQYTKGEVNQPSNPSNSSNQSGNPPSDSKTGGSSTTLVTPTGNFVSNHHPNLSGSPAPNSITSVCNTSPGASCKIWFTNGNVTKSLSAQVTDAGGATYWNWKLQDIGLAAGSWKISATSTMGSASQTSTDPLQLVVSQ
ncbi:MAG: hypothetical protein JWS12_935 [Candidatus Saccharibacteria bacterium]|nr:hypothetical protein [Candidatus Saccharibacteria bacterium]